MSADCAEAPIASNAAAIIIRIRFMLQFRKNFREKHYLVPMIVTYVLAAAFTFLTVFLCFLVVFLANTWAKKGE